ncbi:VQ motif-containing protein 4 [Striga hermonthica]|uniref:VQ motif-containing protein 4 n=1 Tax=Striga hermonthica TaxID=68872 RepID=A0A9N7NKE4_STRHE|nr:VQ motif-containing protein 4 [Striga hermonthica]
MENLTLAQNPSLIPSPIPHSPSSSSSAAAANGVRHQPSAAPVTRSEPNNPYPTTFVQADTSSFKQVVQMLTGSTDTARLAARSSIPPARTGPRMEKSGSKLYERRNSLKNFRISPLGPGPGPTSGYSGSPRSGTPEVLSPSILDFPSLVLSPVTPLIPDPFKREAAGGASNGYGLDKLAEEKAIKEKGFYLHPSPASTPRDSEPRLLPLFPVTSPRVAGSTKAVNS